MLRTVSPLGLGCRTRRHDAGMLVASCAVVGCGQYPPRQCSVRLPTTARRKLDHPRDPDSVYHNIVRKYGRATGIDARVNGLCVHSLRATAATNALDNKADIAKVQEWLGHANISTTRLYDRRKTRPEDSPTFRVRY